MTWLTAALRELFSLFVDDAPFSAALGLWIVAALLLLPRLALGMWSGPLLFVGPALLLMGSVLWRARRG